MADLEYYHNKGQSDYSDNNWDPPWPAEMLPLLQAYEVEQYIAYKAGWNHAKSQD